MTRILVRVGGGGEVRDDQLRIMNEVKDQVLETTIITMCTYHEDERCQVVDQTCLWRTNEERRIVLVYAAFYPMSK